MLPGLAVAMMQGADQVSGFSVSAPTEANRTQGSSGGVPISMTTLTVTATVSGGIGPYTYAWTRISGDSAITATAPAASATAFTATVAAEETKEATFRVTATDTATGAVATADVDVRLHHVSTL